MAAPDDCHASLAHDAPVNQPNMNEQSVRRGAPSSPELNHLVKGGRQSVGITRVHDRSKWTSQNFLRSELEPLVEVLAEEAVSGEEAMWGGGAKREVCEGNDARN